MNLSMRHTIKQRDNPDLLILEEKHGQRYFHVSSADQFYAGCLQIILERIEEGNYYFPLEEIYASSFETEIKELEQLIQKLGAPQPYKLLTLFEKNYLKASLVELESLKAQNKAYHVYAQFLKDLKLCQITRDGKLAWQLLQQREHAEYEGYVLEWFEKIKPDQDSNV